MKLYKYYYSKQSKHNHYHRFRILNKLSSCALNHSILVKAFIFTKSFNKIKIFYYVETLLLHKNLSKCLHLKKVAKCQWKCDKRKQMFKYLILFFFFFKNLSIPYNIVFPLSEKRKEKCNIALFICFSFPTNAHLIFLKLILAFSFHKWSRMSVVNQISILLLEVLITKAFLSLLCSG